ncbi:MAG: hypothetical protein OXI22_00750 [Defluviicoccus sp.]|nr:hypothetical protein [Defluviicoccus sp.]MDE0382386.1 hypothetical protein [Defluviicoccus sp.]
MIERYTQNFRRFLRASEAVSALEYALLVGIITVAIGAAVAQFGTDIENTIASIGDRVETRENLVEQNTAGDGGGGGGAGGGGG